MLSSTPSNICLVAKDRHKKMGFVHLSTRILDDNQELSYYGPLKREDVIYSHEIREAAPRRHHIDAFVQSII
jgi:hypothetical protein